ncbi:site-specific DNA-methyltransferase [Paremcibacter congregatus]|uniref:DNA-methyltransferase n=1 Tax=Paremcibacter congregatus TaxID=2043170 RepID=UPI0030EC83BB
MTVKIYQGQCLASLKTLPDNSVDIVITSPPYWGLRDYGKDGQIGLEKSLQEHLDVLIEIFAEVRRVLKPEGICWVNYGDCYATTPNGRKAVDIVGDDRGFVDKPFSTIQGNCKPKDLCLLPERFVIAMQDSGWWVRAKPIWAKRNPMPESAKDRPTTAYEQLYMFTKSERYLYDHKAVRIGLAESSISRYEQDIDSQEGSHRANGGRKTNGTMKAVGGPRSKSSSFKRENSKRAVAHPGQSMGTHRPDREDKNYQDGTRSLRQWEFDPPVVPDDIMELDIWDIPTKSYRGAHFATFPPDLVYRCLAASAMEKGCVVLDPFGGAGTTGLVADRLQMDSILCELNEEYIDIASDRIEGEQGMFPSVEIIIPEAVRAAE